MNTLSIGQLVELPNGDLGTIRRIGVDESSTHIVEVTSNAGGIYTIDGRASGTQVVVEVSADFRVDAPIFVIVAPENLRTLATV